jgi:hypothetical protein
MGLLVVAGCGDNAPARLHVASDAAVPLAEYFDGSMGMAVVEHDIQPKPAQPVTPHPDPRTASEFVPFWAGMADSIFVATIDGLDGLAIPDPPFVSTTVRFTVTDQVRGSPPQTLTTLGGIANGVNVLASHGPNIRLGNSYLIFSIRNRIVSASLMESGQTVAINGEHMSMGNVRSVVGAGNGGNP